MRLAFMTVFVAAVTSTAAAMETTVGAQIFAGASMPIVQDDVATGAIFGLRLPVQLWTVLSVEPYFASSSMGRAEQQIGSSTYAREGFDVTAFGANVLFGFGSGVFRCSPFVGIGAHELTRSGSEDIDDVGYNFGLGLRISPTARWSIDARGEVNAVATGSTSRKFGNLTLGLGYTFFPMR